MTASRVVSRARCGRADHLRVEDELRAVGVDVEPEPLARGSVVHAGLAAAFVRFPADPDSTLVAAACAAEAVDRGLGASDPRIPAWTRVALRAAWAAGPESWEPVRLTAALDGPDRGEGAGRSCDATARRVGSDKGVSDSGSADVDGDGGTIPLVELRLRAPITDGPSGATWRGQDAARGWSFSYKPDAVMRHRESGRIWLWDHKTKSRSTFSRVEPWTDLHLQTLLYVRALREFGVPVHGAVLYAVLAEEPTVPRLRKDGHLGETAWATDWPTACAVIRKSEDPDPDSPRYDALREACAKREWQIVQEVLFDDAELESAWRHLVACRDELVRSHVHAVHESLDMRLPVWRAVYPSGRGSMCGNCEYQAWCREDFAGRDSESLIGDSYRRGPDKYLAEVALTTGRGDLRFVQHDDFSGIETTRAG